MHELNEIAHKNKNFMKSGSLFFNNLKQKYLNYIKIKTFFIGKSAQTVIAPIYLIGSDGEQSSSQ